MQILPGIYLINGSPYGRHQNGYMVCAGGATVLIDSGELDTPECFEEIQANARRWGSSLEQASHLLVTHAHFDHSSHAAALKRLGLKIVASEHTAQAIAAGDDRCIGYAVHRTFEPCQADVVVTDQELLRIAELEIRCLAAPGHDPGLMVYEMVLAGQRSWFCGDLVLTSHAHSSVELGWGGGPGFDRRRYLQTLARLKNMPCDHLFPGHGPAAISCGHRVIEKAYTKAMLAWQ